MLQDVRPTGTINNATDIASLDTERIGNRLMRFPFCRMLAYLSHKLVSQYRGVMEFAFLTSMPAHILIVVTRQAPIEIREAIVHRIAISMTGFMAWWARTYEGFQNKVMHIATFATPQMYHFSTVVSITFGAYDPRLEFMPVIRKPPTSLVSTPHTPIRTDAVASGIVNVFVLGIHSSIISYMAPILIGGPG